MNKGHANLLSIISDGKLHSGEELASQQEISRAAIWKSIKHLQSLGVQIDAVHSKGYRLANQIELLSEKKIKQSLQPIAKGSCSSIELLFKTNSTNTFLFDQLARKDIHGNVVLAEYQSGGRGRRGNKWISPLASGLIFSVGWHFEVAPAALSLLSLYTGVAIARALKSAKINNLGLKWPNDVVVMNDKIAGILLEVRGEASGPVDVVIGVGINYDMDNNIKAGIEQPVTDICSHTSERLSRNELAALLLSNIFEILESLDLNINSNLLDEWRSFDCYFDRQAKLILPNEEIEGVLKGVDNQGALLISVDGEVKSYTSGEISLRVYP